MCNLKPLAPYYMLVGLSKATAHLAGVRCGLQCMSRVIGTGYGAEDRARSIISLYCVLAIVLY